MRPTDAEDLRRAQGRAREQILAGARRCFAEHGYEGATVARLEHEIGLSRGAIFNYFGSKEDLFLELAVRDNERMSELWVNEGLEAVVREVVEVDPAWLGVYLELIRRVRTDRDFRGASRAAGGGRAREPCAHRAGAAERRVPRGFEPQEIGAFVNLVLNGMAVQRAGETTPRTELVLSLLERRYRPRARPGTPSRTRA